MEVRFKAGETVLMRDWEELEELYGATDSTIDVPFGLTREMYEDLKEKELQIESINEDGVIYLQGYGQYNCSEAMLKYPGEASEVFVRWETKGNLDHYPKALSFVDRYEEQCALIGFEIFHMSPRYMWDILQFLFLPQPYSDEYVDSDAYNRAKNGEEGLVAYAASEITDHESLVEFLNQETAGYPAFFFIQDEDVNRLHGDLTEQLGYVEYAVHVDGVEEDHEFKVYYYGDNTVIVSNLSGNKIVRFLYFVLANRLAAHHTQEMDEAISSKNQEALFQAVEQVFITFEVDKQKADFKREIVKFKSFYQENEKGRTERRIRELTRNIKAMTENLIKSQRQLKEAQLHQIGLDKSSYDENLQMFLDNLVFYEDKITHLKVEQNVIYCQVVQPLQFFSQEEWDMVKFGLSGSENAKEIYEAVFGGEYTLYFEQGFILTYENSMSISRWRDHRKTRGIPNPHMERYDCWGDNQALIVKCLNEYDLTMAFAQIMSAIAGINVSDSPVFNQLAEYFDSYTDIPCLQNNTTGEMLTINQYLELVR